MKKKKPAEAFRIVILDSSPDFNYEKADNLKYLFTQANNDIMYHQNGNDLTDVINFDPNITFINTPTTKYTHAKDIAGVEDGVVIASELESQVLQILAKTSGGCVVRTPLPIEIVDRLCSTNDKVVYYPEIFSESTAENHTFHIIGGAHSSVMAVKEILYAKSSTLMGNVVTCTGIEAAIIEQSISAITGLKYIFMNQLYDFMSEYGGDYNLVSNYINSHHATGSTNNRIPNRQFKRGIQDKRVDAIKNLMNMDKELFTLLEKFDIINSAYSNREE